MPEFLKIVALTAVLFAAQELLRRGGKWVLWGLFGFLPLALTPYRLATYDFGLFVWLKCFTIASCVCWWTALRLTPLGTRSWARRTIPLLLAVNMLEATVLDAIEGGLAHALNAAAGFLLVATIPFGLRGNGVDTESRERDLHCATSRGWIIGYTAWNWTFVSLNYPTYLGFHTATLVAALIVGLIDRRRWLHARCVTLCLNLIAVALFNAEIVAWLDTSHWIDERAAVVVAVAALVVVTVGIAFAACSNTFPATTGRNPTSVSLRSGNTT